MLKDKNNMRRKDININSIQVGELYNIDKVYNDKDLTVIIEERVDTITSVDLQNSLDEDIDNITSLPLDFSKLEYISSAGLRVLIATQKRLNANNIPMTIINVNDTIKEIFRMSGFDKILKIK